LPRVPGDAPSTAETAGAKSTGRAPAPLRARIDHVVVGAESLQAGVAAVERALGVPLSPGGKHRRMGTHNCLLRLGDDAYLEVLAVDPDAPSPDRPRWLSLDAPSTRERLRQGPCLLTWVARVPSTHLPPLSLPVGPWEAFERNGLSWQLTVRTDGTLAADGVAPSLIVWNGQRHPASHLPDAGCRLDALALEHPQAEDVQPGLEALGLGYVCTQAPLAQLTVRLQTPDGPRTLRSRQPLAP
jgi:hypothetical protein